jgi:hypothetical protein
MTVESNHTELILYSVNAVHRINLVFCEHCSQNYHHLYNIILVYITTMRDTRCKEKKYYFVQPPRFYLQDDEELVIR